LRLLRFDAGLVPDDAHALVLRLLVVLGEQPVLPVVLPGGVELLARFGERLVLAVIVGAVVEADLLDRKDVRFVPLSVVRDGLAALRDVLPGPRPVLRAPEPLDVPRGDGPPRRRVVRRALNRRQHPENRGDQERDKVHPTHGYSPRTEEL